MSDTFQTALAAFVIERRLTNLVETGYGFSTVKLLDALDQMGEGRLTSIDPAPWYLAAIPPIEHPRLTWMKEKSSIALPKVSGPWDLFLHDGNHDVFCQTLEYNFALGMLRKGGWLASDDFEWGTHRAWEKFVKFRHLEIVRLGSLAMVQNTTEPVPAEHVAEYFTECLRLATDTERGYLGSGGVNSGIFQEH